jgi:hypothetical protein
MSVRTANLLICIMMTVMVITLCMYVPVFRRMKKELESTQSDQQ